MASRSLDAHVARIDRQDKIATGVLTVIVGLVILLVVAIIAYIIARGAGRALTPGFLTNPYNSEVMPGILYQLWDSFYLLLVTLVISVPTGNRKRARQDKEISQRQLQRPTH